MIIITTFLIVNIYLKLANEDLNTNLLNLFHKDNSLYALIIFCLEGLFYLLFAYFKWDTKCFYKRDLILFAGIYNILLGISLFMMRLVSFITYLLIFYLIMALIIITFVIIKEYKK